MPRRIDIRLVWLVAVLVAVTVASLAGCDDDDDATAPATTGRIRVVVEPDTLQAFWDLAGPEGYAREGTSSILLPDLAPGPYVLAWRPVDGWRSPDPDTVRQVLTAGETAVFTGRYGAELPPLPGRVVIAIVPDTLAAGWRLTGPGGGFWSGTGGATIRDLAAGEYTVAWRDVDGWQTPDLPTATGTLADGSTLVLIGEYGPAPLPAR